MKLIALLLHCLGVTSGSMRGILGGDVAVQREAHSAEMLELRAAQRTVGLAEAIHGVMEAPETKCMTACVHARLMKQLETDGALQAVQCVQCDIIGSSSTTTSYCCHLCRASDTVVFLLQNS